MKPDAWLVRKLEHQENGIWGVSSYFLIYKFKFLGQLGIIFDFAYLDPLFL